MSNQLTVSGTLLAGPATVQDTSFPTGVTSIAFNLNPPQKQVNVDTGSNLRVVNSPSSYVTLSGVGATDTVTQGNTLYLRTSVPMSVRVTMAGTPDVVSVLLINGLFIFEFDPTHYLKLLEVQGSGTVEWYVSGLQ